MKQIITIFENKNVYKNKSKLKGTLLGLGLLGTGAVLGGKAERGDFGSKGKDVGREIISGGEKTADLSKKTIKKGLTISKQGLSKIANFADEKLKNDS